MKRLLSTALTLALALTPTHVLSQSSPGLTYGQVPTAGQWNSYFASKQDVLRFTPLAVTGGTLTGKLTTAPATVNGSGLSILPGVAPTSPTNGDLWIAGGNLSARIAGTTYNLATQAGVASTYAPLASPNLTGVPTAPTPVIGTNTNQIATAAMVTAAVASGMAGAGAVLYNAAQSLSTAQQLQARQNIAAAASGANADITSLQSGVTTTTPAANDNSAKLATTGYADRSASNAIAAASPFPVRQTVAAGPTSGGLPSFLPATSGSLSITATGVSSTVPLIVTAAQGFGSSGPVNVTWAFTANPTWTLTASTTNYLYVNASTGVTGITGSAPVYTAGGTPSTANGVFTFDTVAMIGYMGNGSTAPATPLVFVGEAVTSASGVTSTVAYAYNGRFQSPATAFSANTTYTFSHNIGVPIEYLDVQQYTSNGATGPWLPNNSANYTATYTYPSIGLFGAASTRAVRVAVGPNMEYDNGSAPAITSSGFVMVRVRRGW